MKLLLDTNALIWWLKDDASLGSKARAMIAGGDNELLVSIISLWEVTIKFRVGKMEFLGSSFLDALASEGIVPLLPTPEHLIALEGLPVHHKDPFDHLIIAQALVEDATIITSDRVFVDYGVRCFPAGR